MLLLGLHLRVGQWKRPFSRQQLTSSGKQEFVDRSLTDKAFGAGRDVGMMVHNNFTRAKGLEWAAGVFNGNGANTVPSARFNPAIVAERGLDVFRAETEEEFARRRQAFLGADREALAIFRDRFAAPAFRTAPVAGYEAQRQANPAFRSGRPEISPDPV